MFKEALFCFFREFPSDSVFYTFLCKGSPCVPSEGVKWSLYGSPFVTTTWDGSSSVRVLTLAA